MQPHGTPRAPQRQLAHDRAQLLERMLAPLRRAAASTSAGGVVLLAATVSALGWANSPWAASYHRVWETPLSLGVGASVLHTTLLHLINDGLMAVFFFVVGLEIKREVLVGELASMRRAALPMVGALGGMIVPAVIYALLNAGGSGARGWGMPMATDIAFALGVLALIGDRVPTGLKVFLAALAIADDLGAVLVIAVFYSGGVAWTALAAAAAILGLVAIANAAGVRRPWAFGILGLALWGAVLASGVHGTVAGVLLALAIPVRTRIGETEFLARARQTLVEFGGTDNLSVTDSWTVALADTRRHTAIEELELLCGYAQPPLIRLEHAFHNLVAFGILPLFALANAGIPLGGSALRGVVANPVTLGVFLGLVLGKPIGITAFAWLAVRFDLAALPDGVSWRLLAGAGVLGGIGFTMSLFIGGLAFPDTRILDAAKLGVFMASVVAGFSGWLLLRRVRPPAMSPVDDAR
jgi:NhaA family Na+:H+ antiporter